ncbi:aminotransferase class III-fold pyridoxal phosphate-dependent enzyme, partial [Marinomonas spartinae]|uniref:aminotransferase class III-fold pyridoxal phosphate-dependent enzyme n=1 Tax=Marinomonas spartinae TaxID=1792290 RepID=UPI0018F187B7
MISKNKNAVLVEWEIEHRSEIVFSSSSGCSAFDKDGKEYLDLTACSGAAPLGMNSFLFFKYSKGKIEKTSDFLPSPVSVERHALKEFFLKKYFNHPRSFFLRTGSCATEAAVRIARRTTGKAIVLVSGFHGWHEIFQQPPWDEKNPCLDNNIIDFKYDLILLEKYIFELNGKISSIFITPEPSIFTPDYIRKISEISERNGIIFIVDEVLCGLRYSSEGYCYKHNIRADIITIAKGLAHATAMSAVIGTEKAMFGADLSYLGNTYLRENKAFALANLTQSFFEEYDVINELRTKGDRLKRLFIDCILKHNIPAKVIGDSTMFDVVFSDDNLGCNFSKLAMLNGIYIGYPATYMSSYAMNDDFFDELKIRLNSTLEELSRELSNEFFEKESIVSYAKKSF